MLRTPRPETILQGYDTVDGLPVSFSSSTLKCTGGSDSNEFQQWRRRISVDDRALFHRHCGQDTILHGEMKWGVLYIFSETKMDGEDLITCTPLRLVGIPRVHFASMNKCVACRVLHTDSLQVLLRRLKDCSPGKTEWRYIETLDDLSSRFHRFIV
jgi:hypothetical protein